MNSTSSIVIDLQRWRVQFRMWYASHGRVGAMKPSYLRLWYAGRGNMPTQEGMTKGSTRPVVHQGELVVQDVCRVVGWVRPNHAKPSPAAGGYADSYFSDGGEEAQQNRLEVMADVKTHKAKSPEAVRARRKVTKLLDLLDPCTLRGGCQIEWEPLETDRIGREPNSPLNRYRTLSVLRTHPVRPRSQINCDLLSFLLDGCGGMAAPARVS